MRPGQKIKCVNCNGTGQVSIPGFRNGRPYSKLKECKKCKGTGELVLTLDRRYQKKPGSIIVVPQAGRIIKPN